MLYLSPPFYEIEGVVVATDYSDPRQFWYYPNRPRLAVDDGHPAIRLLVLKELTETVPDDDEVMSFLVFDTVLSWPEETLKKVARKLQQDMELDEEPRLSPLLYRSGTVNLTFLDRKSAPADAPAPAAGDPPPPDDWVSVISAPASPSLYGDNRAIFSVALTAKATKLFYGSFEGFIPAGVVYDLKYAGMQRAFSIEAKVDWEFVYNYIREYDEDRFLFYSDEMEKIVEKLEEKKKIEFKVVTEGVDDEGMQAQRDEVRKLLQQFIFDKFFEPKINPKELLDKDVPGTIVGLLKGVRDEGLPIHFGSSKRTLDVNQVRKFEANYTMLQAVERSIAPQGHLSVFWKDLGITKDDVVTIVDGNDALWRTVRLQMLAVADFGPASVAQITADVLYGKLVAGRPAPDAQLFGAVLTKESPKATVRDWFDPAIGTGFHYRFTVAFQPQAVAGADVLLTSPWIESSSPDITINPETLYRTRSLAFQRSRLLDKTTFPEVVVHLRYRDPNSGWEYENSEVLDEQKPNWTAMLRLPTKAPTGLSYQLSYPRQGADTIVSDWQETSSDMVLVGDPRENLFLVDIMVGDRANLEQILLKLEYSDPENDIFEAKSLRISKDKLNDEYKWQFFRAKPQRTRYRYQQTILKTEGEPVQTGWIETDAATLVIGERYAKEWTIRPEVVGPPLAAAGIESIRLRIAYEDAANDYREARDFAFIAPGPGAPLALKLRNPAARDYVYDVRYVMNNGFERKLGPISSRDTFLVISSVPPQS